MFSHQELNSIDREYFYVIDISDDIVILQSKNTLHGWHIVRPSDEYISYDGVVIYHRHENQYEYHLHDRAKSLNEAIKKIKAHDSFQIKTRWKGFNYSNLKHAFSPMSD